MRILTLLDNYSRECLALRVGVSLKRDDLVEVLNAVIGQRAAPRSIRVDNGTEFTSVAMDRWAYCNGVTLDFSRPGKPQDNALIEALNSRFRQECPNGHWFRSLGDAQEKIGSWPNHYNAERPHSALGNLAPEDFVRVSPRRPSKTELAVLT
jgi:putative transposase